MELAPDLLTLAKIKVHMNDLLLRQPNYTCLERIERSRRRPPRFRTELIDMLRLEVALVDGRELFAWPGSSKFEHGELEKFIPRGGASGNGNFALFARSVFLTNAPVFQYRGETDLEGRRAIRYDYRVPQLQSGFNLKVNESSAVVGFHGAFWADPETLDVLRLEVVADEIPPTLPLKAASTTMDYARVKIGDGDFLLPKASTLSMTQLGGDIDHNVIHFSGCRQYTGESVLTFAETPLDATPPPPVPAAKKTVAIPAHLAFDVELEELIDTEKSMIGDAVRAVLRSPIKNGKELLFAKGSPVSGRIIRIERHTDFCLVDIRFDSVESEDAQASIAGDIEEGRTPLVPQAGTYLRPRAVNQPGLMLRGSRARIPRGFRVRVRTQPAPVPDFDRAEVRN